LNKIDQIKPEVREKKIKNSTKLLNEKILKNFPNFKSTRIVSGSAATGDIDQLIDAFKQFTGSYTQIIEQKRNILEKEKFIMSIDHCFQEN